MARECHCLLFLKKISLYSKIQVTDKDRSQPGNIYKMSPISGKRTGECVDKVLKLEIGFL